MHADRNILRLGRFCCEVDGTNPYTEDGIKLPKDNPSPGSLSGGYGGYGGGGGSSAPTQQQKDAQANLGAIAGYNAGTATGKAGNMDKALDIADQQNESKYQMAVRQAKRRADDDWYAQVQKLQSVNSQLADASGNAMYGSFSDDLSDLIARRDDMDDVAVLNQLRQNMEDADEEYIAALMANNNARNETYADTEESLRSIVSDYAAQSNNIHPDLAKDLIDKDGHTVKAPKFLDTDYFAKHVRDAIKARDVDFLRPGNDATTISKQQLVDRDPMTQYGSSANMDYWQRLRQGYSRRTQ